ncbi:hypothetical protein AAG570_004573 [Ranatra chinensis]|uniref:NF-X1-type domain-containing protein n=1 Tax=Ranatra chinensis TaxID=642074 RepID=A0ABD0Y193_9HEMI
MSNPPSGTNPWNIRRGGGGGRGSGVAGKEGTGRVNAGKNRTKQKEVPKSDEKSGNANQKFKEAQQRLQESVKKHLDNAEFDSSSEEEDLETDDILGSVLRSYAQVGGKSEDLGRTQNFLENTFHSGAAICLICIGTVKRTEAIWNCESCYGFFHLPCVQRWAKDSIAHQKLTLAERPNKDTIILWQCPKCRKDYEPSWIPDHYECFCGRVVDPEFHPWLVPHSCGETCNRPLVPECGHRCLLLCHPGPCPPCPKMVQSNCYCTRSGLKSVRCSQKERSCDGLCAAPFSCGHACPLPCHPPPCPPCQHKAKRTCGCGSQNKVVPCAEPVWKCNKVCGRELNCEKHRCELICHQGDCPPCPGSVARTCPCGKDMQSLPCTQEIPTCGGTCDKALDCGVHFCSRRCHRGDCGMCLELIEKVCRCGLHTKEVPCNKEYICETKCKRMRDCNIHPCNRKCCNGNCPPCEKPCGKTLKCGQHKCGSVCHRGACYPCQVVKEVSCRCGATSITVPCGKVRRTHPPKCSRPCQIPPECHHPTREIHRCHFGSCPPCKQPCGKTMVCSHICSKPCHSAVLTYTQPNYKPASPWEKVAAMVEVKELPCPPCEVPTNIECVGGHEVMQLPCHRAFSQPCGRPCSRSLPCSNHTCHLPCHFVKDPPDTQSAGENCSGCTLSCTVDRPEGCTHDCSTAACHPPPCPPCRSLVKVRCHCALVQLMFECHEWTGFSKEQRIEKLSCGNQCPKKYECGHKCTSVCHSGDCPSWDSCRRKVKVTCSCKRIKKEYQCSLVVAGKIIVNCDEECKQIKLRKLQEDEKDKERQRLEEERRNREEIEKYEKKMQGKKRPRKRTLTDDKEDLGFLYRFRHILSLSLVAIAIGLGFFLLN